MTPSVSVVIPVYNGARYIRDAVDSVLAQTFRDREVIVVDDGSTDNLKELLLPYRGRHAVRYLFQANGGPAKARNTGIEAARGRYIAFLDSDDIWFPDKLGRQMEYCAAHPGVKVVHCDFEFVKDGRILDNELDRGSLIREGWLFENFLRLKSVVFLSCVLLERAVLDRVGRFNESLMTAEDTNLYLRIAREFPFGYVDEVLVHRRIHDANITVRGGREYGTFKSLDHIAGLYPELHPSRSALMRKAYEYRYFLLGCTTFRSGNYLAARPFFREALRAGRCNAKAFFYFVMTYVPEKLLNGLRTAKRSVAGTDRPLRAGHGQERGGAA